MALFEPIHGLVESGRSARIVDLFPEEVRGSDGLAIGVTGSMVTIVSFLCHSF
jgi:hypothetical protein